MHLVRSSIFVIALLHVTLKQTLAIAGCTVTLLNINSARRKVLCADPKGPIKSIPEDLPEFTDMLIISNQNITTLKEDDFLEVKEMKTLSLTFSNLQRIHKNSFASLVNLVTLDLSGNVLTISEESLPSEILSKLSNLEILKMTGNPLGFVPDGFFRPLGKTLRKLMLNKCNRPALRIAEGAFKSLINLEELDLRENGLVSLPSSMELDFREMKSLKVLLVSDNRFYCDCKLRWFYFYLTQIHDTVVISIENENEPRCSGPEKLMNKPFSVRDERQLLRFSDFVCLPKCVAKSPPEIVAEPGSSVNLTCQCSTDPVQKLKWTKNGHIVEETANKYKIHHSGRENFLSTLNIVSLQPVDSGNWSCKLDDESIHNFSLKVKTIVIASSVSSIKVYILVGLGSSLFLIALVVVVIVMFCRREAICNFRNHHPMVICGYETNVRKSSIVDGDLQYRYNQHDGRYNTSFYENTIPFDSRLSQYQRSNHLYPDDLLSEKSFTMKGLKTNNNSRPNNDKLLNVYCGCNYNSDDDPDPELMRSSYTQRSRLSKSYEGHGNIQNADNREERFQQLKLKAEAEVEKLIPNIKQCPFHGSSGTLTRIPGEKPCPVHGSTSTLPSRLSSKKVEHRFGCPKHSGDNISVKSLKFDSSMDSRPKPHRCKSVNKIPSNLSTSSEKLGIITPSEYRPCPLHGDLLAAINENMFEPLSNKNGIQLPSIKKAHSKSHQISSEKSLKIPVVGCDKICRKPNEIFKNRNDLFQSASVSVSQSMTSPVQSSLSSSPLLTSDVHGTLV